jgi:hypothetical protein
LALFDWLVGKRSRNGQIKHGHCVVTNEDGTVEFGSVFVASRPAVRG